MEAQYVNIAFLLILNAGAIPDACRDWQCRTPVNQTWAEFRISLPAVQDITQQMLQNIMKHSPYW
jgi:hypothetical protein